MSGWYSMTQEQQQAGDGNQPEDSAPTIIGPTAEVAAGVGGVAVGGDVIGSVIVVGDFDPDSNKAAEQYQEYVLSLIRRYDKQAFRRKLTHNGLQLTIFIGAAAATVLVA